ncbi:macro domain-containing protein [Vibrio breoganii]
MSRITILNDDVIDATFKADSGILIHGCNALGRFGRGVAGAIRERVPMACAAYFDHYKEHGLFLGDIVPVKVSTTHFVVNAITQERHARYASDRTVYVDYDAIELAFARTAELAQAEGVDQIYFPKIGCGLANGEWPEVEARILTAVPSSISLYLCVPSYLA